MFGKPAPEVKLDLSQLPLYLDTCFDNKLRKLESNAEQLINEIERSKSEFESACDAFDRSEEAPDTEYTPRISASYIKSSKSAYIKSLHSIFTQHRHAAGSGNIYSKYSYEQAEIEDLINSVLKTNMQFNSVLLGYSSSLGNFKRTFSVIERCNKNLKGELGLWSREVEEYRAVSESLHKLEASIEERDKIKYAMKEGIDASKSHPIDSEGIKNDLTKKFDEEKSKLRHIETRRSALEANMASILLPLERAARKYDHYVGGRSNFTDYITKPLENITDKSTHDQFMHIVDSLSKEIDSGKLEIKNRGLAIHSVEAVKKGEVMDAISEIRSLDGQISAIRQSINGLEHTINEIKGYQKNSLDMQAEQDRLRHRDAVLANDQASIKKDIEEKFLRYYKVKVLIQGLA
jgi:hypothetical protein